LVCPACVRARGMVDLSIAGTWHGRWDRESAPGSRSEVRFLRPAPI